VDENARGFDKFVGTNLDRVSGPRRGAYKDVQAQSLPLLIERTGTVGFLTWKPRERARSLSSFVPK